MLAIVLQQLADTDVDPQFLKNVILTVLFISQAVTGWALLTGKNKNPQPFEVTPAKECAPKGEFDKHVQEVWTVINGIRRDITAIREHMAALRALRDDNGNRLGELERDVKEITRTIGELVQALHEHNKRD